MRRAAEDRIKSESSFTFFTVSSIKTAVFLAASTPTIHWVVSLGCFFDPEGDLSFHIVQLVDQYAVAPGSNLPAEVILSNIRFENSRFVGVGDDQSVVIHHVAATGGACFNRIHELPAERFQVRDAEEDADDFLIFLNRDGRGAPRGFEKSAHGSGKIKSPAVFPRFYRKWGGGAGVDVEDKDIVVGDAGEFPVIGALGEQPAEADLPYELPIEIPYCGSTVRVAESRIDRGLPVP